MNSRALRCLDLLLLALGSVVLLPIMLVTVAVNFLHTRSPIFRQERLGRNQVPFILFKFRTMERNTISVATHLADLDTVSPLGRFLRWTKLDELPQLWNVLTGDMSLVGPRPGLNNQPELTKARVKLGVFDVRPGITGLAQINGIDMSTPHLLAKTDAQMIAEMSVYKYFKYIFLTVAGKGIVNRIKSWSSLFSTR